MWLNRTRAKNSGSRAARSSSVRIALSRRSSGRSSGVVVAFVHCPRRSGSPHGVRGTDAPPCTRAPAITGRAKSRLMAATVFIDMGSPLTGSPSGQRAPARMFTRLWLPSWHAYS